MDLQKSHTQKISQISTQLRNRHQTHDQRKVRFFHGSSNSTRIIDKSDNFLIDISSLDQVIHIDPKERTAIAEPNVSMDKLVNECLKYHLIPKVIMEFPAITCGGAINGAALESSSYKYGQFNDTCSEIEVILGDGSIIPTSRKKNSDLFYGISGSYGSLGLISSVTFSLTAAKPFVHLTLIPTPAKDIVSKIKKEINEKEDDYLEGIIFNTDASVILKGILSEKINLPVVTFSKPADEWFYLYVKKVIKSRATRQVLVPLKDYLFRYNRGAFWMAEHAYGFFHIPLNRLTRILLDPFMKTKVMYQALQQTSLSKIYLIQDFYIPLSKADEFINFCDKQVKISPIWLCPVKATTTPQLISPHYLREKMLIDVGIWGPVKNINSLLKINLLLEKYLIKTGGRKMLYAETFYTKGMFWKIYNQDKYTALRKRYHAEKTFPDVWQKINVKRKSYHNLKLNKVKIIKTTLLTMLKTLIQ